MNKDLTKQEKDQLDKEIYAYWWKYDNYTKTAHHFNMTIMAVKDAILRVFKGGINEN